MDSDKFKQLLQKVGNVRLERPSDLAKLSDLQTSVKALAQQVEGLLSATQSTLANNESVVGRYTSELINLQNKNREKSHMLAKQVQNSLSLKESQVAALRRQSKQLHESLQRRSRILQGQLRAKNQSYITALTEQLISMTTLKEQAISAKKQAQKNYEKWMEEGLREADRIIASQEKDLEIISDFERDMLGGCLEAERRFQQRLRARDQVSQRRQKALYRKMEALIGQVDTE